MVRCARLALWITEDAGSDRDRYGGRIGLKVEGRTNGRKGMEKGGMSVEVEESEKAKEQEEGANKRGTRGNAAGYRIG